MQGRNPSTAIPGPDQKRKQRLRVLRNCTIVVLVVISHDRKVLQNNLPASLGKPFLP